MIEPDHPGLPIARQCELLHLSRSSYDFEPRDESDENLALMRKIDEIDTAHPFYGCRKFAAILEIDKDRANRLMRKMGIEVVYPQPGVHGAVEAACDRDQHGRPWPGVGQRVHRAAVA